MPIHLKHSNAFLVTGGTILEFQ